MRVGTALSLIVVLVLLAGGCGGGDAPPDAPAATDQAPAAETTPAAEETPAAEDSAAGTSDGGGDASAMFVAEDEPSAEHVAVCKRSMDNAAAVYDEQARVDLLKICDDFGSSDPAVFERAPERLCLRQAEELTDADMRSRQEEACLGIGSPFVP